MGSGFHLGILAWSLTFGMREKALGEAQHISWGEAESFREVGEVGDLGELSFPS